MDGGITAARGRAGHEGQNGPPDARQTPFLVPSDSHKPRSSPALEAAVEVSPVRPLRGRHEGICSAAIGFAAGFPSGFSPQKPPETQVFRAFRHKRPGENGDPLPHRRRDPGQVPGRFSCRREIPIRRSTTVRGRLAFVPRTGSVRRLARPTETLRRDSRSRRSRPSVEDRRLFPPSEAPRARGGEARKGRARGLRIAPRVVGGPLLMAVLPEHSPPVFETLIRGGRPPYVEEAASQQQASCKPDRPVPFAGPLTRKEEDTIAR